VNTCPGTGQVVVATVPAEPLVRDLRNGRGKCPVCRRTLGLTSTGKVRVHAASRNVLGDGDVPFRVTHP
jgi:hypothetical protein